jgi:hypothetical protein
MLAGATPVRIDGEHGNQALQEAPPMRTVRLIDFTLWADHNFDIPRRFLICYSNLFPESPSFSRKPAHRFQN